MPPATRFAFPAVADVRGAGVLAGRRPILDMLLALQIVFALNGLGLGLLLPLPLIAIEFAAKAGTKRMHE